MERKVWNAFAGYRDVYGQLPSKREVWQMRALIVAESEREAELYQEQQDELENLKHKNDGNAAGEGHSIRVR